MLTTVILLTLWIASAITLLFSKLRKSVLSNQDINLLLLIIFTLLTIKIATDILPLSYLVALLLAVILDILLIAITRIYNNREK